MEEKYAVLVGGKNKINLSDLRKNDIFHIYSPAGVQLDTRMLKAVEDGQADGVKVIYIQEGDLN